MKINLKNQKKIHEIVKNSTKSKNIMQKPSRNNINDA